MLWCGNVLDVHGMHITSRVNDCKGHRVLHADSIPTSLSVLPDPENLGKAVGISLLSCLGAEINIMSFIRPVYGHHLWFPTYPDVIFSAAILDFWLSVSYGSVTDSTIEQFDPVNIGVAVGIVFLVSLEAEIHLGVVLPPFNTNVNKITFNIWGLKPQNYVHCGVISFCPRGTAWPRTRYLLRRLTFIRCIHFVRVQVRYNCQLSITIHYVVI